MYVTVLGAGDMGTAICAPIASNGHDVRLWGTRFDDHVVAALRSGQVHPRLQYPIPGTVRIYGSNHLRDAVEHAELVILAVTSSGIDPVLDLLLEIRPQPPVIVSLAKGLYRDPAGSVCLLCDHIERRTGSPALVVGGPAKANEVVMGLPTVSVLASPDAEALATTAEVMQTAMYRFQQTLDRTGVEISAALKNAYAIAVGVATGMELATGAPHQNFKAALFPAAVLELARLADALGGSAETVYGLSGSGDLTVTVSAGRNRLLGELLGRGQTVEEALGALTATGMTIEGHAAVDHGMALARQVTGNQAETLFPLLAALHAILYEHAPVFERLWDVVGNR